MVQIGRLSKGVCRLPKFSGKLGFELGSPQTCSPMLPDSTLLHVASSTGEFLRRMHFLPFHIKDSAALLTHELFSAFAEKKWGAPVKVSDFGRTGNYVLSWRSCKPHWKGCPFHQSNLRMNKVSDPHASA